MPVNDERTSESYLSNLYYQTMAVTKNWIFAQSPSIRNAKCRAFRLQQTQWVYSFLENPCR